MSPNSDPPSRPARNPKVVFSVGGLYSQSSGVDLIVCSLANALARQGYAIDVYAAACKPSETPPIVLDSPNRLVTAPGSWWGGLSYSPALRKLLDDAVSQADLVHNHSLWMLPTNYASRIARRNGNPVVFSTHGFLEPWALANSRWKKRLAAVLFQDRDLRRSSCLHANSESELPSIRAYGLRQPIAVIPNGVDLAPFEHLPARSEFVKQFPDTQHKKICLYLSRLHAKKGLAHLVTAWKRLVADFPDWQLVIAGPDYGFESQLRAAIASLGIASHVTLAGPLYDHDKLAAFSSAAVFVLPSFSEGFSNVVLEAMACRLPVLVTPGCNFPEIAHAEAGVVVAPDVAGTEQGLRRLLAMDDVERKAMGSRGRRMIEQSYTWDRVAQQLSQLYHWLASGTPRPEFVHA